MVYPWSRTSFRCIRLSNVQSLATFCYWVAYFSYVQKVLWNLTMISFSSSINTIAKFFLNITWLNKSNTNIKKIYYGSLDSWCYFFFEIFDILWFLVLVLYKETEQSDFRCNFWQFEQCTLCSQYLACWAWHQSPLFFKSCSIQEYQQHQSN